MKDLEWLKAMQLEIQEHEEGKWIEIHLSETVDDKDEDDDGFEYVAITCKNNFGFNDFLFFF